MRIEIIDHINSLEKTKKIKILMAVESGSRAWGCPSPDSDYDVRIIYCWPKNKYLEIHEVEQSMDYFIGKELDINGWDIKKTLGLILKSNATPFEWAQSPIVYKEVPGFRNELLELSRQYFQPRHSINHYRGIAKNSYLSNADLGSIKLKKLFYVLRPIMAAKWIIERNEVPPMDIPKLLDIVGDKKIVDRIQELLRIKESVNEDYVHAPGSLIRTYIEREFDVLDSYRNETRNEISEASALNTYFVKILDLTNDN